MKYQIRSVCICGAGTMGSGIALAIAQNGLNVLLYDVEDSATRKAKEQLANHLKSLTDKGKVDKANVDLIFSRIAFTSSINDCIADMIIEAVVEKKEVKTALLNQLAEINPRETIFATNTSSLSVTEIASKFIHPEQVIGLHFFNPATIMRLVEVVKTEYVSDTLVSTVVQFAQQIGKTPVVCNDSPGFLVNRVARQFYLESLKLVEQNIINFETIDELTEAAGFKMGPFKLMDLIGIDVNYAVSCSIYDAMHHAKRLKPSDIQKNKVESGTLGRKTGQGFYEYR